MSIQKEVIPTKFSEWLKEKMAERGETQYKVAKALSVSQSTVSNWLSGNNPTRCHKRLVAEHFDVAVEDVP